MVKSVTSLGRSGVADWIVQRVSAVVLLAYILFMGYQVFCNNYDYAGWVALFDQTCVRVFSMAALLALAMHAWVGLWCISTDYITTYTLNLKLGAGVAKYANLLRWGFQAVCAIILFTYVVWGIQIFWG